MRIFLALLFFCFVLYGKNSVAAPMGREVLALYDGKQDKDPFYTMLHQTLESVFNYYGLILRYHDIQKGLPENADNESFIGLITWFQPATVVKDSGAYIDWLENFLKSRRPFVMLGNPGFIYNETGEMLALEKINRIFSLMGLRFSGDCFPLSYNTSIKKIAKEYLDFERPVANISTGYCQFVAADEKLETWLEVVDQRDEDGIYSIMASWHPGGVYIASGVAIAEKTMRDFEGEEQKMRKWSLNPFVLVEKVFFAKKIPIPDVTTAYGLRQYFSHIDGDGWLSVSQIPPYSKKYGYASEVVLEEILKKNPDLPVTVAPIAAELDLEWNGTKKAQEVAREILAMPQVEVASHTHSHPFDWRFFDGNPEKERSYLVRYRSKTWGSENLSEFFHMVWSALTSKNAKNKDDEKNYYGEMLDYDVPRAYAKKKFSARMEVDESIEVIKKFAPSDKEVALYQWSGNALPFEEIMSVLSDTNLPNLNGGGSRFDSRFDSYSWLYPVGRAVGKYWQIYAPNANENVYTGLWTRAFHGFRYVTQTFDRTEYPRRIKPINVYYHMYSGEKAASLKAVQEAIDYAKSKPIHPMKASIYAKWAQGFFTTKIEEIAEKKWKIINRGELQSLRLEKAMLETIDYENSSGVIGHRYLNGNIYVTLDAAEDEAIIALKPLDKCCVERKVLTPLLRESSWRLEKFQHGDNSIKADVSGFGGMHMVWHFPQNGEYKITLYGVDNNLIYERKIATDASGVLKIEFPYSENLEPYMRLIIDNSEVS